jgi:tRNA threonylcarbamoyladenosine biosynthesis protein TsaE
VPILREGELDIISHSPEQTYRLGVHLGALIGPGDVILLSGDMGAGKTMFAAGIGKGWGAHDPVTSPTFTLVHMHSRAADAMHLYHLDCYRLRDAAEAETIGLDDILNGRDAALFEWPEHIADALPDEHLYIALHALEPTRRNLVFTAHGARYRALLGRFSAPMPAPASPPPRTAARTRAGGRTTGRLSGTEPLKK